MANCPNCGSTDIQLKRDSNVNWGRAIAGWALFGVVGGAVGAVTGKDRSANACLNCGTVWRAEDLYKLLQYIESVAKVKLDMSVEGDRRKVNIFTTDIMPLIEKVELANQKYSSSEQALASKASINLTGIIILWVIVIALPAWAFMSFQSAQNAGNSDAARNFIFLFFGIIIIEICVLMDVAKTPSKDELEYLLKKHTEEKNISKTILDAKLFEFTKNIINS
jgi:hypothetical protein